ncbi:MAG: DUF2207 domain-containing protein [Sciscionella sp.]
MVVVAGLLLVMIVGFAPTGWSAGGEQIDQYVVDATVQRDGAVAVTEKISYDFGFESRHGIFRAIPTRYPLNKSDQDANASLDDRVIEITNPTATLDGRPVEIAVDPNNNKSIDTDYYDVIRLGDPNGTVSGRHTYQLRYLMRGTLNEPGGTPQLYWNALGDQWMIPINSATVRVHAPGRIDRVRCQTGSGGTGTDCPVSKASGDTATFGAENISPRTAMTVATALPRSVSVPAPIIDRKPGFAPTVASNFVRPGHEAGIGAPAALGVTAALLVIGAVLLTRLLARGRDYYFVGLTPGIVPGPDEGHGQALRRLGQHNEIAVRFNKPDAPPALCGGILNETVGMTEVSATITDLAVRGYLRVEDDGNQQHTLVQLAEPDDSLARYEQVILEALFADGPTAELASLRIGDEMRRAHEEILDELVHRNWYQRRPDLLTRSYRMLGGVLLVGSLLIGYFLLARVDLGLWALPFALGGLALLLLAGRMPSRTAVGTAILTQVLNFRRYLEVAEAEEIAAEERRTVFNRYLPYAQVLGMATVWTKKFEALGAAEPNGWYTGADGLLLQGVLFSSMFNSFAYAADATLPSMPASSSDTSGWSGGGGGFGGGGFGGGGMGGGGGGSW